MKQKHSPLPQRLYKYNPSSYCGVLMPEKVVRKLAKLTNDFEQEVRRILTDNIDDLYEYHWSLAYPNGKQTDVVFADKCDLARRIALFKARQPEYCPEVYLGNGFDEKSKEVIAQIEALAEAEGRS